MTIINQIAASDLGERSIGRRVWFGGGVLRSSDSSAEIIGIVGDVAYQVLAEHPSSQISTHRMRSSRIRRVPRARSDAGRSSALVPAVRHAVREADPNLALFEVRSMEERFRIRRDCRIRCDCSARLPRPRRAARGDGHLCCGRAFGRRSRREIGVRVALGATPGQIIASVGKHGARPAMVGVGVGMLAMVLIGRVLASSVLTTIGLIGNGSGKHTIANVPKHRAAGGPSNGKGNKGALGALTSLRSRNDVLPSAGIPRQVVGHPGAQRVASQGESGADHRLAVIGSERAGANLRRRRHEP